MRIQPAQLDARILSLLSSAGLPTEDLADGTSKTHFFVCEDSASRDNIGGVVGVQLLQDEALLRSLVVDAAQRDNGIGKALVDKAEQFVLSQNLTCLFLLTNTAENFFRDLAYQHIERQAVPPSIQNTREYSGLCPQDSVVMCKELH